MRIKKLACCVALSGIGAFTQAQAALLTFGNVGNTGSIFYEQVIAGATLQSTIGFTLTGLTSTQAIFNVTVENQSFGDGANTLMSFGFDTVAPTLTSADASGIWDTSLNTNFPSFQQVDLCVYASNNCTGGNINNGLGEGLTSTFTLTLATAGNFLSSGISFGSPYSIKFQGAGTAGRSYEFEGCIVGTAGCDGSGPPNEVPEPSSLALVGLALAGTGLFRRKTLKRA